MPLNTHDVGGHDCGWDRAEMFVLEALKQSKANESTLYEKCEDLRIQLGELKIKVAYISAGVGAGIAAIAKGLEAFGGN